MKVIFHDKQIFMFLMCVCVFSLLDIRKGGVIIEKRYVLSLSGLRNTLKESVCHMALSH